MVLWEDREMPNILAAMARLKEIDDLDHHGRYGRLAREAIDDISTGYYCPTCCGDGNITICSPKGPCPDCSGTGREPSPIPPAVREGEA